LLDDDSVENIDINGFQHVYVEYANGSTARVRPVAGSDEELIETIQTLAAHEGLSPRAFDVANVRVNLRLPDGSRLYAVQSVTKQPVVSIRRHRHRRVTLKDLLGLETIDQDMAEFLAALVRAHKNVMVAGATGAGKTTCFGPSPRRSVPRNASSRSSAPSSSASMRTPSTIPTPSPSRSGCRTLRVRVRSAWRSWCATPCG